MSNSPVWSKLSLLSISVLFATQPSAAVAQSKNSTPPWSSSVGVPSTPGRRFQECSHCPAMIVIPKGKFNAQVQRFDPSVPEWPNKSVEVHIDRVFAAGVYDITFREFAEFMRETKWVVDKGCEILDPEGFWIVDPNADWRHPFFRQTPRDPVVCVSWEDAQAYIRWLNSNVAQKHGGGELPSNGPYRLLSEEELAYLSLDGVATPPGKEKLWQEFGNWGTEQCWPCGSAKRGRDRWYYTSPVGSFLPNKFGLYDIGGNVHILADDCFHDTLDGVPTDGSAWILGGDCTHREEGRVVGFDDDPGSSNYAAGLPDDKRIASLIFWGPHWVRERNYANGFRVARSLN